MKQFEDLWEENGGGIFGKRACEKYYRGALEWVLALNSVRVHDDVYKDIEKELKGA